ncbi:MAG: NAD-dependent epimerase/dehydratase family protein [Ilumatobacteraceae bacterium]
MRALVTGAAGFIGSTLCERLLADGWAVRGIDALTDYYDPSVKERNLLGASAHPAFELVRDDLRTADLAPLLADVEVVFHLAAQPGVRTSWADGFAVYDDHNIRATQRLLEAVRQQPGTRLVFASSSSVYGNPDRVPTEETDATRPFSPYGVTKLAGEHLCRAYADNFGVSVAVLRYFTVYGPRQRPDMAIHRLIEAARRGTPFALFGDGSQIRDFTFVDDVVAANIAAAVAPVADGAPINVAGGSSTRLIELVAAVGEAVGAEVPIDWRPAQPGDVGRTGGAVERAAAAIGWAPRVALAEGIARQVEWHRATFA